MDGYQKFVSWFSGGALTFAPLGEKKHSDVGRNKRENFKRFRPVGIRKILMKLNDLKYISPVVVKGLVFMFFGIRTFCFPKGRKGRPFPEDHRFLVFDNHSPIIKTEYTTIQNGGQNVKNF